MNLLIRRILGTTSLLVTLAWSASVGEAWGQSPAPERGRVVPFAFAGSGTGVGEDFVTGGFGLRGGLRLPLIDVSVIGERWGHFGDVAWSSALVEANYFPVGGQPIAPFLTFGIGRSWGGAADGSTSGSGWSGGASSFGLGLQASPWRSTALRAEALLRDDAGAYVGAFRFGIGIAPTAPPPRAGLPRAGMDALVYGMAPLRGPWRLVEPGYGIRFNQPLTDRLSGSLAFTAFHWHMVRDGTPRRYVSDTRAFVGMPGVQIRLAPHDALVIRGGPAVVMMGEGADAGANLGANVEAASTVRPLGVPLTVGAGWLWMPRGTESIHSPGVDQNGLTFFGGVHF